MNLLHETLEILDGYGKTPEDVEWCGWCGNYGPGWFTWREFEEVAATTDYDSYSDELTRRDLVVVGDNWWLERHDNYDQGQQWWEFKRKPQRPAEHKTVRRLAHKLSQLGE